MDIADRTLLCNKNIVASLARALRSWSDYTGTCLVRRVKRRYVFPSIIHLSLFYIAFLLIPLLCDVAIWRVKDKNVLSNIRIFFSGETFSPQCELQLLCGWTGITRCNYDCIKTKLTPPTPPPTSLGCLNQSKLWLPYFSFYLILNFYNPLTTQKIKKYLLGLA